MAQTAQTRASTTLFATGDLSKLLRVDRVLTASPAPYWVWPFKNWIPAYQAQKGRVYQHEGLNILQKAEESSDEFREGPAQALRQDHAFVVDDLKEMCQNPETVSASALRRYKRRARRSRNNIVISSEAFLARKTCCIAVGAKDDTGMPTSVTSVTTINLPPPRHDILEPKVLSLVAPSRTVPVSLVLSDAVPSPTPENTVTITRAQLASVQEEVAE
ncbi:hypothetical protein L226DRAFT_610528 [Lentinus tigrinus ALCF2SS1-7]|uniref:uncharacterized protein n=1 Tax=Lentinus tigrinus ALCF2SS1-7 TaxID=1328758 RepID=UPI001166285C|nr:hypothetical protein L226DRAFT_610528 [Lentinus tigrinus ALCF2SS1-7]